MAADESSGRRAGVESEDRTGVDRLTLDDESIWQEVRQLFRRHPRLRAFPIAVALLSAPLLFVQLWVFQRVMHDLLVTWSPMALPFGVGGFLLVLQALVVAFSVFVGGFALVVAAGNAAVVHNVRRILEGDPVSVLAGVGAAARALPQVVVLALVWAEGGGLMYTLERRERPGRLATLVTRLLGIDVAGSMYFAVPAAVLDGAGPVQMFRRSYSLTTELFGGPTILSFGFVRGTALGYGLPLWLVIGLVVPVDAVLHGGTATLFEAHPFLLGGVPMLLAWLGACTGFAFAATAKTLLYVGASSDRETVPLIDRPVTDPVGEATPLDGTAENADASAE
ncbi:hypothetical protein BRC81_03360 [Halobacteriales archaeon QS_1_68_20]|nr:MAG: hypothetical protein BRC81_03360 [Halobacteriales archaeon QS_1_68_20]